MVTIGTSRNLFQPPELGLTFLVDKAESSKKLNKYNLHGYMTGVNKKFQLELIWSTAGNRTFIEKPWWLSESGIVILTKNNWLTIWLSNKQEIEDTKHLVIGPNSFTGKFPKILNRKSCGKVSSMQYFVFLKLVKQQILLATYTFKGGISTNYDRLWNSYKLEYGFEHEARTGSILLTDWTWPAILDKYYPIVFVKQSMFLTIIVTQALTKLL